MTCLALTDGLACTCTTRMSLFAELGVGSPPSRWYNHTVTTCLQKECTPQSDPHSLLLQCVAVLHDHGSMERPLPAQNIHELMVRNQLVLLLVVDMKPHECIEQTECLRWCISQITPTVTKAMRQRKLGSHTPPCHRRMVITTMFSVTRVPQSQGGGGGATGQANNSTLHPLLHTLLHTLPLEFWCRGYALAKPTTPAHYHTYATLLNQPFNNGPRIVAPLPSVATTFGNNVPHITHHLGIVDVVLHAHQTPQLDIVVLSQANTSCGLPDSQCPMVAAVLLQVANYARAYKRNAASWRNARSHGGSVRQSPREYDTTIRLSPCHEHVRCHAPMRTTTGCCDT